MKCKVCKFPFPPFEVIGGVCYKCTRLALNRELSLKFGYSGCCQTGDHDLCLSRGANDAGVACKCFCHNDKSAK